MEDLSWTEELTGVGAPVVDLSCPLPPGFSLRNDGHLAYLYYEDAFVAVFSATKAIPEEIRREAVRHLQLQEQGG